MSVISAGSRAILSTRTGGRMTYLECPCCGNDGAVSNDRGEFHDGQSLICDCSGGVSVDEDGEAWINNGDALCPQCDVGTGRP